MKKFISVLAVLLCFVMLFTSCFGKDSGDKGGEEEPKVTTGEPEVVDPKKDIEFLVKDWNDTINAEAPAIDMEKIIKDILDKYQLEISDVTVDGAKNDFTFMINSEELYFDVDGEYGYGRFVFDGLVLDMLEISGRDQYEEIQEALFDRVDLGEYFGSMEEIDMPDIKLPELSVDDFIDEGNRVYTFKREAIDRLFDAYIDAIFEASGIADSDKREAKALINGYLEDAIIDFKYRIEDKDNVVTLVSMELPEEVYIDILDNGYGDGFKSLVNGIEHEYAAKIAFETSKTKVSGSVDLQIPANYADYGDGTYDVQFVGIKGEFNLDISELLSKSAEKIKIDVDITNDVKSYMKSGDSYVVNNNSEFGNVSGTIGLDVSFVGDEFSLAAKSDDGVETNTQEFSCKVSIGKANIPELGAETEELVAKFMKAREKYDAAVDRAEDALETALNRLDPDKQVDTWADVSYYDEEIGAYFVFEVMMSEDVAGYDYSLWLVSFTEPLYSTYVLKGGDGNAYAIYDPLDPSKPIENFEASYDDL